MRRIEKTSGIERSTVLEFILVAALLGAALTVSGLGDLVLGVLGGTIANLHAS